MTIFNRKKHSCCSTFLDVIGLAELSQGVLDYLTTPLAKVVGIIYFFLTDVLHSCFQHQ